MTTIKRIKQILSAEGYPVNLTHLSGGLTGPLIVSLCGAEQAREMSLLSEVLPRLEEDSSGQKAQPLFSQTLASS